MKHFISSKVKYVELGHRCTANILVQVCKYIVHFKRKIMEVNQFLGCNLHFKPNAKDRGKEQRNSLPKRAYAIGEDFWLESR